MDNKCCGQELVLIGTAVSLEIAKNKTPDELNLLGSFFSVIGDQLQLIGAAKSIQ